MLSFWSFLPLLLLPQPSSPRKQTPRYKEKLAPAKQQERQDRLMFCEGPFFCPLPAPSADLSNSFTENRQTTKCPPPTSPTYLHMSLSFGLQGLLVKWLLPRSTKVNHAFAPEASGPSHYSLLQPPLILPCFTVTVAQPPGLPPSSQTSSPLAQPFRYLLSLG